MRRILVSPEYVAADGRSLGPKVGHVRHHSHMMYTLCILAFIFAVHFSLPTYVSSSFLKTMTTESTVGILYILSAVGVAIGYLVSHRIIRRFKTYHAMMGLCLLQLVVTYGIATAGSIYIIGTLFVLSSSLASIIGYIIDVIVETNSTHANTGRIRGLYMTAFNFGWVAAPIMATSLVGDSNEYRYVYLASCGILVPLIYLIWSNFRGFHDTRYTELSIHDTVIKILKDVDLRKIFSANIILNTFYAWMVIYTPIYLHSTLGFSWEDIGVIFTVMLVPFVILEIPLGKIADTRMGEKELMTLGFIIMGVFTVSLAYIPQLSVLWWAVMLFMTRVGAATAELMMETYFFKKIATRDVSMLSLFRVTRQAAYVLAPLITGIGLTFVENRMLFVILGIVTACGAFYSLRIKDTN